MEILSAKIVKSKKKEGVKTLSVDYITRDKEGNKASHEDEYTAPVHVDLTAAFKKLTVHYGLLIEEIDIKQVKNPNDYSHELTDRLVVTSFSKGGKEEDPGVIISGYKILKSGKITQINSPFTRFSEEDYKHMDHLQGSLAEAEIEIEKYVDGKHGEIPGELPFGKSQDNGDASKTTVGVLNPESGSVFDDGKPKRGRKKAVAE